MFKYLAANLEMPFASVSVVVVVVAAIDGNNPYRNVLVLLSRRRPFRLRQLVQSSTTPRHDVVESWRFPWVQSVWNGAPDDCHQRVIATSREKPGSE